MSAFDILFLAALAFALGFFCAAAAANIIVHRRRIAMIINQILARVKS